MQRKVTFSRKQKHLGGAQGRIGLLGASFGGSTSPKFIENKKVAGWARDPGQTVPTFP